MEPWRSVLPKASLDTPSVSALDERRAELDLARSTPATGQRRHAPSVPAPPPPPGVTQTNLPTPGMSPLGSGPSAREGSCRQNWRCKRAIVHFYDHTAGAGPVPVGPWPQCWEDLLLGGRGRMWGGQYWVGGLANQAQAGWVGPVVSSTAISSPPCWTLQPMAGPALLPRLPWEASDGCRTTPVEYSGSCSGTTAPTGAGQLRTGW